MMGEEPPQRRVKIFKTISLILTCGGVALFFLALFIWVGLITFENMSKEQSLIVSFLSFVLSAILAIIGDRLGEM